MGDIDVGRAIVTFFGFLVALTMHEAAHAFAAKGLGDNSTETTARATINPVPHIDIFGTIVFPALMLISGSSFLFGWAKPTQVDSRGFKKLKRDINLVALSGPACNFFIAIACGIAIKAMGYSQFDLIGQEPAPALLQSVATANIVIGVFNLIPFPASDGWRILINSLNYNLARKLQELSTPLSILMLILLLLGVFHPVLGLFIKIYYILLL